MFNKMPMPPKRKKETINNNMDLSACDICPRNCRVNRYRNIGNCLCGAEIIVNCHHLHYWEEPPISGSHGSGTIFFAGCNMHCVYCQNYIISQKPEGRVVSETELVEIFFELQETGAHNINLVTPTHFSVQLRKALSIAKKGGLKIPVVWNSNAYEKVETLKILEGLVDIYLPDFRYFDSNTAIKYSCAPHYPEFAKSAILEMFRQVGNLKVNEDGIASGGLLIRILVLPQNLGSADKILEWIAKEIGSECHISLMGQYYPAYKAKEFPELSSQLSRKVYESLANFATNLGFCNGFFQAVGSSSDYTPDFSSNARV